MTAACRQPGGERRAVARRAGAAALVCEYVRNPAGRARPGRASTRRTDAWPAVARDLPAIRRRGKSGLSCDRRDAPLAFSRRRYLFCPLLDSNDSLLCRAKLLPGSQATELAPIVSSIAAAMSQFARAIPRRSVRAGQKTTESWWSWSKRQASGAALISIAMRLSAASSKVPPARLLRASIGLGLRDRR